jgi:hypothetical protein
MRAVCAADDASDLAMAALTLCGLIIGIAGYSFFERIPLIYAYVNAAMILSGMGPIGELKTTGGKASRGLMPSFQASSLSSQRLSLSHWCFTACCIDFMSSQASKE